jgi:hypothetical protein
VENGATSTSDPPTLIDSATAGIAATNGRHQAGHGWERPGARPRPCCCTSRWLP